ncbi:ABC transporter substrate-binding protein [Acidisoma silvae]|uniref:ABC transporter substrate-binding protein n=1 Tax=Acidisoma silvae TaxID=2802396 RepID=A0A963YWA6_9PROT|nr:ABC transporter substrate-binding protein [Acidisoma silvae]MCB8877542.1 ABC transporter substrate-binding protein [Acidisoma silvae]
MFRLRLFTLAAAALLPFAAHAQSLPPDIAQKGVINVALNADYPPLELHDPKTNAIEGFDIDLAGAAAKILNVKLNWQDGPFEQMIPSLQSGRSDMIMSGIYDIPKRRALFDFVDYLKAGGAFYTTTDNTDLKTLTDLCGKTVSTSEGTNFPTTIKAWSDKTCVAAGKPAVVVITDASLAQELTNLRTGRADAAMQGLETIPTVVQMQGSSKYRPLGEPISSALMGAAFPKSDTQLRNAWQAALLKTVSDGTYETLIKKWKLDYSAYPSMTLNQGPTP